MHFYILIEFFACLKGPISNGNSTQTQIHYTRVHFYILIEFFACLKGPTSYRNSTQTQIHDTRVHFHYSLVIIHNRAMLLLSGWFQTEI